MTILSYLAPHQKALPVTFSGGLIDFQTQTLPAKSQAPSNSLIEKCTQMPAPVSESQLSLDIIGRLGDFSQVGNRRARILAGPKPLVLNSSSTRSWLQAHQVIIPKSLATTEGLSKAGGEAGAKTRQRMECSIESMMSQVFTSALSTHAMSQARKTLQTAPPEVSIPLNSSCSQPRQSPRKLNTSSSPMTNLGNPLKLMLFDMELHHIPFQSQPKNHPLPKEPHSTLNPSNGVRHSSHQPKTGKQREWNAPLPRSAPTQSRPIPYHPDLTPEQSPLRPHCLSRDRIQLWKPYSQHPARGQEVGISNEDLDRIGNVISHAWTENTRQTYGTGLLIYHIFCDKKQIPEPQ